MQEPKYIFKAGGVFNRASGEMIPEDEPIIVFRARDIHAAQVIRHYATLVNDDEHRRIVLKRADQFEAFAAENADSMKEPDTQLSLSL